MLLVPSIYLPGGFVLCPHIFLVFTVELCVLHSLSVANFTALETFQFLSGMLAWSLIPRYLSLLNSKQLFSDLLKFQHRVKLRKPLQLSQNVSANFLKLRSIAFLNANGFSNICYNNLKFCSHQKVSHAFLSVLSKAVSSFESSWIRGHSRPLKTTWQKFDVSVPLGSFVLTEHYNPNDFESRHFTGLLQPSRPFLSFWVLTSKFLSCVIRWILSRSAVFNFNKRSRASNCSAKCSK